MTFAAYLLLSLLLAVTHMIAQQPPWRIASGTEGGAIYAIDVYRGNPDTLYANENYHFLRSIDRGNLWDVVSSWPSVGTSAVRVDPTDSKLIYVSRESNVLLEGNEILRSIDGGISWQLIFVGRGYPVAVLEIDPIDPRTIYAGVSPSFIFRSTDRGTSWDTLTQPPGSSLISLAIAQTNDSILYAGYISGTFKSTDRGNSWIELPFSPQRNLAGPHLVVDPTDENVVYAGVYPLDTSLAGGMFKSIDGGFNWTEINNGLGLSDRRIIALILNPKNRSDLLIGVAQDSGSFIFRSTDGGLQWLRYDNGLPNAAGSVGALVIDTLNNRVYAAGGSFPDQGIFVLDSLTTSVYDSKELIPLTFSLFQNYPNPFNPSTRISYTVNKSDHVTLQIFDLMGREAAMPVNENKLPGSYEIEWNGEHVSSGVYFYQLTVGGCTQVRKMELIR